MYNYRKLNSEKKIEVLKCRKLKGYPEHEPPHLYNVDGWFLITSATYEHQHHFHNEELRLWLLEQIFNELHSVGISCNGWVVLPNHYHLLVECKPLSIISEPLRRIHARTARSLNLDAGITNRRVWYRFTDRAIRNDKHYYTTLNYIHYNPTKHGYSEKPLDWSCSSANWYLEHFGIEWLRDSWRQYPIRDYGKDWE